MDCNKKSTSLCQLMFGFDCPELNGEKMSEKAEQKIRDAKLQHRTGNVLKLYMIIRS